MKINQYKGREILCGYCGTKYYKTIDKSPEKITAHKKNCPMINKLVKGSIEI